MKLNEIEWNWWKNNRNTILTLFLDRIGRYNFYDKESDNIWSSWSKQNIFCSSIYPTKSWHRKNRHFTERIANTARKFRPKAFGNFWLFARQGLVSETGARNMAGQVISAYCSANVEGAIVSRNGNHQCRLNVMEFLRSCAKFASGAPRVTV